jgi:hypothetical protein
MDTLLLGTAVGCMVYTLLTNNSKECFEPTYLDSEQYYKTSANNVNLQNIQPSQAQVNNTRFQAGYNNPYASNDTNFYPISNPSPESQQDWIAKNSLYNKQTINGIPLKDYYEKYTKEVLSNGTWFLNKNMPEETKQYLDNSQVQQRMEMFTGLRDTRDREMIGVANKRETLNFFTPQERTTGYGYQYGSGGSGPGISLTRQKEYEDIGASMKFKNNEKPFEAIHVGRGIALDASVPAAGGFQQYARIVPDNISDYKANQLPGVITGGKWALSNAPTAQQPVIKHRPNTFYSLCQRGPAPEKSTVTAETLRPDYSVKLKNQNRSVINYGYGVPLTTLQSFLVR